MDERTIYIHFIIRPTGESTNRVISLSSSQTIDYVEIAFIFAGVDMEKNQSLKAAFDFLQSGGRTYLYPRNADPLGDWLLDGDQLRDNYSATEQLAQVEWLTGVITVQPEYEFHPEGDEESLSSQIYFIARNPNAYVS